MATVHSSVPDAMIACSSASRLDAPPLPRISRDVSDSPPMTSGSSAMSTSLCGAEYFDSVIVTQHRRVPPAAGHDLLVDRDGDTRPSLLQLLDQRAHGRSRVEVR